MVSAQYGWWQGNEELGLEAFDSLGDSGANYNRLISDDHVDPISGSIGLRSSVCEISPINGTGKFVREASNVASPQSENPFSRFSIQVEP